ncbi:hypothetical protein METP2_02788 [Methanosarcinales archaeon]|nr:hypothetical protein METP2_02788 [Methanosarcinales archaeon]
MLQHKINFDTIELESPIEGVKYKKYRYNNKQMRLIGSVIFFADASIM